MNLNADPPTTTAAAASPNEQEQQDLKARLASLNKELASERKRHQIIIINDEGQSFYNPAYLSNKNIGCILQYWIRLCGNKVLDYHRSHIGKDH